MNNVKMLASLAAELSLRGTEVSYPSDVSTFLDTPEYWAELSAWTECFQAELAEALDMCPSLSDRRQYDYLLTLLKASR